MVKFIVFQQYMMNLTIVKKIVPLQSRNRSLLHVAVDIKTTDYLLYA